MGQDLLDRQYVDVMQIPSQQCYRAKVAFSGAPELEFTFMYLRLLVKRYKRQVAEIFKRCFEKFILI